MLRRRWHARRHREWHAERRRSRLPRPPSGARRAGPDEAARYPRILLQSRQIRAIGDHCLVTVRILVREHEDLADIPVSLEYVGDSLVAGGEFDLRHAELGLTPYSVVLRALQVAERMHVRYRIVAQRDDSISGADQQ